MRLWDCRIGGSAKTVRCLRNFAKSKVPVTSVAFATTPICPVEFDTNVAPNPYAVYAAACQNVYEFDLRGTRDRPVISQARRILTQHSSEVNRIHISPDGWCLVSCDDDGEIRVSALEPPIRPVRSLRSETGAENSEPTHDSDESKFRDTTSSSAQHSSGPHAMSSKTASVSKKVALMDLSDPLSSVKTIEASKDGDNTESKQPTVVESKKQNMGHQNICNSVLFLSPRRSSATAWESGQNNTKMKGKPSKSQQTTKQSSFPMEAWYAPSARIQDGIPVSLTIGPGCLLSGGMDSLLCMWDYSFNHERGELHLRDAISTARQANSGQSINPPFVYSLAHERDGPLSIAGLGTGDILLMDIAHHDDLDRRVELIDLGRLRAHNYIVTDVMFYDCGAATYGAAPLITMGADKQVVVWDGTLLQKEIAERRSAWSYIQSKTRPKGPSKKPDPEGSSSELERCSWKLGLEWMRPNVSHDELAQLASQPEEVVVTTASGKVKGRLPRSLTPAWSRTDAEVLDTKYVAIRAPLRECPNAGVIDSHGCLWIGDMNHDIYGTNLFRS